MHVYMYQDESIASASKLQRKWKKVNHKKLRLCAFKNCQNDSSTEKMFTFPATVKNGIISNQNIER